VSWQVACAENVMRNSAFSPLGTVIDRDMPWMSVELVMTWDVDSVTTLTAFTGPPVLGGCRQDHGLGNEQHGEPEGNSQQQARATGNAGHFTLLAQRWAAHPQVTTLR
jgi:hypothetical protein